MQMTICEIDGVAPEERYCILFSRKLEVCIESNVRYWATNLEFLR